MPVKVFGGHDEAQLSALNLNGHQFRRFGETLLGIQAAGKVNMSSVLWDPIIKEITQPLDYGGTPRKVQFRQHKESTLESTGLSNWMTFDTPGAQTIDEEPNGILDPSTEDDYRLIEKVTMVTANAEVLKSAIEHLSTNHDKTSDELGTIINALSSQIHDVSVRLGHNQGFVGSSHDSAWNGITIVHEKLERTETIQEKQVISMVDAHLQTTMQARFNACMSGGQILSLIGEEVSRLHQLYRQKEELSTRMIRNLQGKIQVLEAANKQLVKEVGVMQQTIKNAVPQNFNEDWKLVFDFFIRNMKPVNPPKSEESWKSPFSRTQMKSQE
jgi:hypothetical protein